jgi:hypothetical protein
MKVSILLPAMQHHIPEHSTVSYSPLLEHQCKHIHTVQCLEEGVEAVSKIRHGCQTTMFYLYNLIPFIFLYT